jgi:hypothetical protein
MKKIKIKKLMYTFSGIFMIYAFPIICYVLSGIEGLVFSMMLTLLLEIKRLGDRLRALEDLQNSTNSLLIAIKNLFD